MAAEFYDASEELIEVAKGIIQKYHSHLVEARIKYLFRTGNWEVKKRDTWGQAKRVSKEVNFLTGYDFIVTIHQDVWEQLSKEDREALMDHELQHCSAGSDDAGNKIWYVQGHDLEDFHAIIRRHGLWSPALKKLEKLLNQTELQFEEPEPIEEMAAITGRPDLKVITSQPIRQLAAPDEEQEQAEETPTEDTSEIIDAEIIEETSEQDHTDTSHLGTDSGTGTEG